MSTPHRSEAVLAIATLALVMAVFLWGKSIHDRPQATKTAAMLTAGPQATIKLQDRQIRQHDDWWSIDIKYPEFEGADVFNMAVSQNVTANLNNFKKELPKTATTGYPDYGAYLKATYTAQVLKNGVVSVLFDYDEYAPGAVHPWGVLASINYDTRVRRVIALSDLFRPQSHYVSRLSGLAIESLDKNDYADKHAIRDGAGPVESNFKVFTLTDTDLVLHFQQYQVAAGAMGSEQVVIPLTRLAPLLRKQYRPVP